MLSEIDATVTSRGAEIARPRPVCQPSRVGCRCASTGRTYRPWNCLSSSRSFETKGALLPTVTAGKLWRIGLTAAIQRTAADGRNIRSLLAIDSWMPNLIGNPDCCLPRLQVPNVLPHVVATTWPAS